MCLLQSSVQGIEKWNWDGDVIIHNTTLPSSRPVAGKPAARRWQYDTDIREFLVSEHNSVVQRTLMEDIPGYIRELPYGSIDKFRSRNEGAFDYRAFVLSSFISDRIYYRHSGGMDPWQFPAETLCLKHGDCEDRAFLLASLLLASGISAYNVRVALGRVEHLEDTKKTGCDHAWVMYKNEQGRWTLLEPLPGGGTNNKNDCKSIPLHLGQVTAEYHPLFVFNRDHLWGVISRGEDSNFQDHVSTRKRWTRLDPSFVGQVHKTILNEALRDADGRILNALNRSFTRALFGIAGPLVDSVDRRSYDPREHFDNCYIDEGWALVRERLAAFRADPAGNLDAFALAAHAIADFYGHTSYVHFAEIIPGISPLRDRAALYDPDKGLDGIVPDYSAGGTFDLASDRFTVNDDHWSPPRHTRAQIPRLWAGRIISGRYGQSDDTWPSLMGQIIEGPTRIPRSLIGRGFAPRFAVPHHNEIAVDDAKPSGNHVLYSPMTKSRTDRMSYANQYKWRTNAAIEHIRMVFNLIWNTQ
jgi:hypothetical protein